jgi:hypothetical protein
MTSLQPIAMEDNPLKSIPSTIIAADDQPWQFRRLAVPSARLAGQRDSMAGFSPYRPERAAIASFGKFF